MAGSRGKALGVLTLTGLVLVGLVILVTSAFASKQVVNYIGGPSGTGEKGGEFSNPRDVAVNATGAGGVAAGTFYVADDTNNRIQRFGPNEAFVSAWGANVVTPSVNEVQTITVNATGGTYTLSLGGATTGDIAYNATAAAIQTALGALPTVGGEANLEVFGEGPFTIDFKNGLSATNLPQLVADDSLLSGTAATATATQGSGQYEICTVASECRAGAATGGANVGDNAKNGSLNRPQSVAVDNDTGNVYVSDRDNRRVNEYSATGTFIRSFGWSTDASVAGEGYEVCPASDRCQFGAAGAGAGQIGSTPVAGTLGIAVSPADGNASNGTVFLADSQNRRVNTYNLDGTSPSSFGSSATFEAIQPRKIAVDSRGIVYASNSKNRGEIERYDSSDANGGGTVFLAPITGTNSSPAGPLPAATTSGQAAIATSGLAVHPDADGAGPDQDILYVLRDPSSGNTVVQQFGPSNAPGLIPAPTAVDDTHGGEAGFDRVQGLGLDHSSGRLFVSDIFAVSGLGAAHRVYILDESVPPAATIDPVTSFDAHSATFSGSVNPNGSETKYRFEYVDDADFQATGFTNASRVPISDVILGHGESPIPVDQETPHHLVPGTTYHVRLVAKRMFSTVETIGGPVTFTTLAAAPSFKTGATAAEEEVTLRAAVNPEGQVVTDYRFEWGSDESYGNTTPAGTLPASGQPVAIEERLTGLTSGQTYHYRLVATSAAGTTTGPDQTFTTTTPPPPVERSFELVSPYPTGGVPVVPSFAKVYVSEDGDVVDIGNEQPFPGTALVGPPDQYHQTGNQTEYISVRGNHGWHVEETGWSSRGADEWSRDASRYLFATEYGPDIDSRLNPDDQNHPGSDTSGSHTGVDLYQRQPDGSVTWISRDPRIPVGTPQTAPQNAEHGFGEEYGETMSTDGGTVVFSSKRQLGDEDTTASSTVPRLYKWEEGQLTFIGKRPDGSVPTEGTFLRPLLGSNEGMVSRDGSRVIFSAQREDGYGEPKNMLYIQTDGQPTVEATKATGVPPLPPGQPYEVIYRGAASDLSRAFFTSNSRLTPDSGAPAGFGGSGDLYVYDINADRVRDLTPRLDGIEDPMVDPATADSGRALGLVANSANGKRVYFVADAQYDVAPNPEGQLPSGAGRNLYLAELDEFDEPIKLRFIASLGENDAKVWQAKLIEGEASGKPAFSSPDGSVLAFGSSEELTGQALGGTNQIFVYDAAAESLTCASCPGGGLLPSSSVNLLDFAGEGETTQYWQGYDALKPWVSSRGQVFFHTATPLLPADQNNVADVYEYFDGQLRLISSGTGTRPSRFEGVSPDGNTVVFNTFDALVPKDKEPGIPKLYAARVGGGEPSIPPEEICDLNGGSCEGEGTHAANQPGAGSAVIQGPGNLTQRWPRKPCPRTKRKVRRHGRVHCLPRHHRKRHANHNRRAGR